MLSSPRLQPAIDLAILIACITTINLAALQVTERYAGPISASCAVILITVLLQWRGIGWRVLGWRDIGWRGIGWRDLGMRRPSRPLRLFYQVPIVLVAWLAASYGASTLVGEFLATPDTSARFGHLAGYLPGTLWWIAIGWLTGGFAEEMIFRGFVLNRLQALMPRGVGGTVMAVLLQAILFGAVHAYDRGLYGLLVLGTVGAVLGTCYVVFGRNLWPIILAHGLGNTLGMLVRYLDFK